MHPFATLAHIRPQDILDILFLSIVGYQLYIWFRDTKAFKVLLGLLALGIIFTIAESWGLFLTTWMFQILWQVLIVLLIILFQPEIRQALERVNPISTLGFRQKKRQAAWIAPFCEGIFQLARRKIGALVVLERKDLCDEWMTGNTTLEAVPSQELVTSIFNKDSPLHDGAMLIRQGHVAAVACYVPLSTAENLPPNWGTRHRAGLGISERCDAWAIVVSEERGEVSLARNGKMGGIESPGTLAEVVTEAVLPIASADKSWKDKVISLFSKRWQLKLGSLALVSVFWLLFAGQQDFEVTIRLPVVLKNIPPALEVAEPFRRSISLTARGLRKDASTLSSRIVEIKLDMATSTSGYNAFRISRELLGVPNDRIDLIKIEPSEIYVRLKEKTAPES